RVRTLEETTTRRISGYVRGRDRRRSGDLTLFRRALCQLSYPALFTGRLALRLPFGSRAVLTGFEPAASALTGRRALQTAPQDLGAPRGVRIPVTALKGRRPRPLDDGGSPHLKERMVAAPPQPGSGRRRAVLDRTTPLAPTATELSDAMSETTLERGSRAGEVLDLVGIATQVVELSVAGGVLGIEEVRGAQRVIVGDLLAAVEEHLVADLAMARLAVGSRLIGVG